MCQAAHRSSAKVQAVLSLSVQLCVPNRVSCRPPGPYLRSGISFQYNQSIIAPAFPFQPFKAVCLCSTSLREADAPADASDACQAGFRLFEIVQGGA